jgi:DMSO reductase anchor subunit
MRPAFSVIFFTVMSGCGYGLLFLLGLLIAIAPELAQRKASLIELGVGALFVVAGLLSSTLHLGQPQRAWRAFSQWRSSWLSREGVVSVASFAPMLALAGALWCGDHPAVLRSAGLVLVLLAGITVICTARIYSSLKTIPAWHNRFVLPGYLVMGLLGGAVWLLALVGIFDDSIAKPLLQPLLCWVVIALAIIVHGVKRTYWKDIDTSAPISTTGSATGLGRFGSVHSVEAPHTEENYLTQEMGFVLARKHAARLRNLCRLLIGAIPLGLAVGVWLGFDSQPVGAEFLAAATAASVTLGLFIERWLFFAQAKHVVMLFYGGSRPERA